MRRIGLSRLQRDVVWKCWRTTDGTDDGRRIPSYTIKLTNEPSAQVRLKSQSTKFGLAKIGQGQPRVIIWTNYDGLESQMLHTKFHGNRSTSSGDFEGLFTIYGAWWPSLSCDQHHVHWIFISLYLKAYIPNWVKTGPVVSRRPSWLCDQHHVHGFLFPCTWKLTYKIWLKMAQWFLIKASFNFQM